MPEDTHNIRYVAVARIADKTVVADYITSETGELTKGLFDGKVTRVLASERVLQGGRLTILDKDVGNINYDADPACLYLGSCFCCYYCRNCIVDSLRINVRAYEKYIYLDLTVGTFY
jgi:hypothetical protein